MAKTIYLISIGKLSNICIKGLVEDYIKRIKNFFEIVEIEIKEFGFSNKVEIEKEGNKIIESIAEKSFVIVCDQHGRKQSSEGFFKELDRVFNSFKSLTIIIGGAYGLSEKVKNNANLILSLSDMTFTHQLAKLIVVEQIYRYCMDKNNHPFIK